MFGPFSGYRAKLFTRVILVPAQRNYIEKGTLPPKSAPQNKIGLKFLLQKVEFFRRQPGAAAATAPGRPGLPIGLSPIETGLGWRLKISTFCSKNFSPILFWGADLGGRVPFSI